MTAALTFLAGCSTAAASPSTDLRPLCENQSSVVYASPPRQEPTVVIRQCDDISHPYLLPRGWVVEVVLTQRKAGSSSDAWRNPVSSNPGVLAALGPPRLVSNPQSADSYLVTAFKPHAPGTATVSADSVNCTRTLIFRGNCDSVYRFTVKVQVT